MSELTSTQMKSMGVYLARHVHVTVAELVYKKLKLPSKEPIACLHVLVLIRVIVGCKTLK